MSSEMNGVLIMMIYIVKQDNVMHDEWNKKAVRRWLYNLSNEQSDVDAIKERWS